MKTSAITVLVIGVAIFIFSPSLLFAAEAPFVLEKGSTNDSAPSQCIEESGQGVVSILCRYTPLDPRCIKEKPKQKEQKKPETATVPEKPQYVPIPVRRRPAVVNAPYPIAYKTVNGRKVCGVQNDHPHKSNKGKGKHMDMECCLDPDEYPNPHCFYPPEKYGKYLK